MPDVTRRRLLTSAAAGAGGMLASSLLPPALARAAANGPQRGSLDDVEHVVIHMQENRSFDHYFGTLAGVRGFGDPNVAIQPNGKSLFYQQDPYNPNGYLLPWHLDTTKTSSQAIPSTSHAWSYQHESLNITVPSTTGQPTTALNDNWIPSHYIADGAANYWYVMGYYEREDIPFHFALAETFTICDAYHCSLLGPTWPNRMYLMTGTIDPEGVAGGPMISNVVPSPNTGSPYTWQTYPEALTKAGISWRIYQEEDDYGTNVLEFFESFQNAAVGSKLYENGLTIHGPDRFEWDAQNDRLPAVSWIVPTSGQSEHPAYLPASGANYLASKLNAVAANDSLWKSTVFIINYDENDGLFDHVIPPLPPAGTPGEFAQVAPNPSWPIGGGVRVPCFVISPWTVGGYVATEQFDHTSVLQFLELVTGVKAVNLTNWRRQTFGDLTSALGFSKGKQTTFPQTLPNTISAFWTAETEVATLPPATIPGASQTPPTQESSRPPLPWRAQSRSALKRGASALPATASRLVENRTSHRGDFAGQVDKVYLARLAEVENARVHTSSAPSFAYVPGIVGGVVAVINASTYALVSAISGTTNPYGVAATPDGSTVFVTESGTNTVSVIPTATNKITSSIVVGIYPHGIAVTPDGKKAYVANTGPNTGAGGSQTVSVIDVASLTVTGTVSVGEAPMVVAITPDGTQAFVSCDDGIYVINVATGRVKTANVKISSGHGVAITPNGSEAYATDSENNQVVVLDTSSLRQLGTIAVGQTPWNTAFTADGKTGYVSNANDDTVSVINTTSRRLTGKIALGGATLTAKNSAGSAVSFPVGNHIPTAIALGPDGNIWVTCNVAGTIPIIDPATNKIVQTVDTALGNEPTGIAFT